MTVTVVAGNPEPGSRTLAAATLLATKPTGAGPDRTGRYLNETTYTEDSVMDAYVARWRPVIEAVRLSAGAS
jgi:hypothetical protein